MLYGFPGSLCSQKVRLALAEKHVPYVNRLVDIELRLENYEPWYLRLNSRGVVPTLVHGDRVVTDSARILRYVDEEFEGPSLIPEAAHGRERMEHWIEQQDRSKLRELSYASFKGALGLLLRRVSMPLRLSKLRRLRDATPDLAGVYDAKLEDVLRWRATTADTGEIARIRRELEAVLRRADEQLGETRYLAADSYSLADVAWTCVLARLKMMGLDESFWGAGRLARVEAYYEQLRLRPSFLAADIWEAPPTAKFRRAFLKSVLTGSQAGYESR
jgi:glutathione S-transferase